MHLAPALPIGEREKISPACASGYLGMVGFQPSRTPRPFRQSGRAGVSMPGAPAGGIPGLRPTASVICA